MTLKFKITIFLIIFLEASLLSSWADDRLSFNKHSSLDLGKNMPRSIINSTKITSVLKEEESKIDFVSIFSPNSEVISEKAEKQLAEIATALNSFSLYQVRIIIEGHSDKDGDETYNLELSQKRAEIIKKILIEKYGISKNRLDSVGHGSSKPLVEEDSSSGKNQKSINRRITLYRPF